MHRPRSGGPRMGWDDLAQNRSTLYRVLAFLGPCIFMVHSLPALVSVVFLKTDDASDSYDGSVFDAREEPGPGSCVLAVHQPRNMVSAPPFAILFLSSGADTLAFELSALRAHDQ